MTLLLFYYRTYVTQDVAAEVFGVGQATVSRSIDQIAPVVRQAFRSIDGILRRSFPAWCLIDASEQQVQRPKKDIVEFLVERPGHRNGEGLVRGVRELAGTH